VVDLHLPVLGDLHLVTSLFFDVGVYVVVVGLVLDLLRSLGSAIDRDIMEDNPHRVGEPTAGAGEAAAAGRSRTS
jgi:multicomponent Na+:H+ antiporter subunit A